MMPSPNSVLTNVSRAALVLLMVSVVCLVIVVANIKVAILDIDFCFAFPIFWCAWLWIFLRPQTKPTKLAMKIVWVIVSLAALVLSRFQV